MMRSCLILKADSSDGVSGGVKGRLVKLGWLKVGTLPETNKSHLKHWGWFSSFWVSASCQVRTVSFGECSSKLGVLAILEGFRDCGHFGWVDPALHFLNCKAILKYSRSQKNKLVVKQPV